MLSFTSDQWVIVALIFILGLLVGGFLFSGGGRKWKHRYNSEVDRRTALEKSHVQREKEWREQESKRTADLKHHDRDISRDRSVRDTDGDGVRDARDRDPIDDRRV
jgi:hypothetical protein